MPPFNRIFTRIGLLLLPLFWMDHLPAQLIISEISPNATVEALEQYGGGEWFEICNVGQVAMDISGYTVGHYEDSSFGQSDFYLGFNNDNCDCGGSYGVIKFTGTASSGDVILPAMECITITGMTVDCGDSYYCLNARDLMLEGPSGIVAEYNSSRSDYPGSGNGNGKGALEGHYWRQKNYECNAYYIWNAEDQIIDAVNFNCLPQTGPDEAANELSGGFHYPDGNGGYHSYPPSFPTAPAEGPFPVGIEITSSEHTWLGESIEEGFTFQRCSNDPNFVFPPMKYDENGNLGDSYYLPSLGTTNQNCCTSCDNNTFFQGIQLPGCTNGSAVGLSIEENEHLAEQEILSSQAPSCNNYESRLRSNYDDNSISFCTVILTPNQIDKPYVGFVNSLDEIISADDCSVFTSAELYTTVDCTPQDVSYIVSSKGRAVFALDPETQYTLCFNYDISDCAFKNRVYWDNPCFSPFYCELDVVCPEVIQDTVDCLADLPIGINTIEYFTEVLGGEILSSCDELSISVSDSLGQVSGPKNQKIYYQTYTIEDGLDATTCTIEYYVINSTPPQLSLSQDTIFLSDNGTMTITEEYIVNYSLDQCNNPVLATFIEPDFVDGSDLGQITVSVTVIDTAENETTLMAPVIIADNTSPIVNCPNDTILMVPPCSCESEFMFNDPIAFDENGGQVMITRIDTTGLVDGDLFPAGTTTISYSAEDESGNITICSYDVTVESGDPGPILIKDSINFSLSEICDGYPTAAMFIQGTAACDEDSYVVTIFDNNNSVIDPDSLWNYRNQLLEVEVAYACFGNSAISQILIEDKFPPQIACTSDTISCDQIPLFGLPMAIDNCDPNPQIILINEVPQNVSCTDPNLSRIITRTYTAIDSDGRMADTCYQVLSISKFDLNTVTFPSVDTLIYCGNITELDNNGNPSPTVTGSPMAGNLSLWPDQNTMCGVSSMYDDIAMVGDDCGKTIIREWTVFYWDCFQDQMRQFFQEINIVDSVGPSFACPDTLNISAGDFSCETQIDLPLPLATDQCNNGVSFNITYPDGYVANASSISRLLPQGENKIILEAVDLCGKTTVCDFIVNVIDNDDPIAIVGTGFAVQVSDAGTTLTAEDFDKGSFDICGPVILNIARMDDGCGSIANVFDEEINICCEDVGSNVMVQFLVTDQAGNTNMAMIAVSVEDITAPVIVSELPDITISCDFGYSTGTESQFGTYGSAADQDTIKITAELATFSNSNLDGVVSDQCGDFTVQSSVIEDYNISCGTGSLTRNFIITDAVGNSITAEQIITFLDVSPLTKVDINWPDDYEVTNESCSPADYVVGLLPAANNLPQIDESNCADVAFDHLDDVDFGPFTGDTLFVINRQWTAADWCQSQDDQFLTFDSTQLIVVRDTREPTIIGGCPEINECNNSPTCEDLVLVTGISAMDLCTPANQLIYSFSIDFDSDGSTEVNGSANTFSFAYPIGTHTVSWQVTDAQGNSDFCIQTITVENCQLPSPICLQNQEFSLVAVDTDNDNIPDDEQITIIPSDIDGGTSSPCDGTFTLSFSPDVNDVELLFDCADIGEQIVQLYVTDENNNQAFCEVIVNIVDDNDEELCGFEPPLMLQLQGNITNELGTSLDAVTVKLSNTEMAATTFDGHYAFPEMDAITNYAVLPEYDTYALDGITTLDIIKIRKHILGIQPLTSPYQLLAADVDNSGSINGLDIITIRKLILGKTLEFTEKNNWEFIATDHTFTDEANPWDDSLDGYILPDMGGEHEVDFFAIKTGDLNFSSSPFTTGEVMTRTKNNMLYTVIEDNSELIVGIKLANEELIQGFQFSFNYNPDLYSFKEIVDGNIKIEASNTNDIFSSLGVIDVSWDAFEDADNDGEFSFYLIFDNFDAQGADFFELQTFSEGLKPQVYYTNGEISSLSFAPGHLKEKSIDLFQNEPNPWQSHTNISFYLPTDQYVSLRIYDVTGKTIFNKSGTFAEGINEMTISNSAFGAAGIYYYSLNSGSTQLTKKMILLD